MQELTGKNAMPQKSRASLRNRDAHGRHKKTSHARIYRNWQRPKVGRTFCAAHGDVTKRHFMRGFKGKMPRPEVSRDVSCEPAQSKCPWTCHKSHFHPVSAFSATICKKYAAPQKLGARACADAMHMDMSQEQFNKKGAAPPKFGARFVRACGRNAHGHVTRAALCKNSQENPGTQRAYP